MENLFFELTFILICASLISILFRYLKQPPILAYILTGIIIAQLTLFNNESTHSLEIFSKIGITLLLFVLGLEFKLLELRSVGKVAIITALIQTVVATLLGFLVFSFLGFGTTESLFLGFATSFSSTVIIVKMLTDKREQNSLQGKIAIGFLLAKDFGATLSLIYFSLFNNGQTPTADLLMVTLVKILLLVAVTSILSLFIFPRLIHSLSQTGDILFTFSLAWAFGFTALISSQYIGFPIEIGGFLAGIALANAGESSYMISKIKSLRDFFLILFFVFLGTQLDLRNFQNDILPAIVISLFILIIGPIIVMTILGFMGFKGRTSFLVGLTVAQISEFTIEMIILGRELHQVTDKSIGVITLVAIITFSISTYLIANGDRVYDILAPYLKVFERKGRSLDIYRATRDLDNHIVLLGADRMGRSMLKTLSDRKDDILVMDFNPDITKELRDDGFNVIFGDIADEDILNQAGLDKAKIIISTIPDFEDNIILINFIKQLVRNKEKKPAIMVTAHRDTDKHELKDIGADYVIMPYHSAGRFIGKLIKSGQIEELI